MNTLKECALPFYLTGGTAISRGYFHHRYSDDLDFFVNDIPAHFGEITETEIYYRTDSLRNMLSNKYSALLRIEAKDVVDICEISKHYSFNWKEIMHEADQKEGGLDPRDVCSIFTYFRDANFKNIKWINEPNIDEIKKNIEIIARDMLIGGDNSLCG